MEPLMERCSSVVHLSGVRRSVSFLVLFLWQDGGVWPVNRLQTYVHRCRPTQAPCGLQSHETRRVSTHCTLKSKAACLRLFGFKLGEKRCACVIPLKISCFENNILYIAFSCFRLKSCKFLWRTSFVTNVSRSLW